MGFAGVPDDALILFRFGVEFPGDGKIASTGAHDLLRIARCRAMAITACTSLGQIEAITDGLYGPQQR